MQLDVGPFHIPARATDRRSGFYVDVFVFHAGPEGHTGAIPDHVHVPAGVLLPLRRLAIEGRLLAAPADPAAYLVATINAMRDRHTISRCCAARAGLPHHPSQLHVPAPLARCHVWWTRFRKDHPVLDNIRVAR